MCFDKTVYIAYIQNSKIQRRCSIPKRAFGSENAALHGWKRETSHGEAFHNKKEMHPGKQRLLP